MSSEPVAEPRVCLMCGLFDDPTEEHIIPQALWRRFDIDPGRPDLDAFRTTLCDPHNAATSALHKRTEVLDLFEHGEPVTRKSLTALADWAVWVLLLFGLARGSAVLGQQFNRDLLLRRFGTEPGAGGLPKGVRVYAARVSERADPAEPPATSYMVALADDDHVVRDGLGQVIGISIASRSTSAAESIIIGKVALLVLGRTVDSGPDHLKRLDEAAATLGLECIWPPTGLPDLQPRPVSSHDLNRLFKVTPFAGDHSLAPRVMAGLLDSVANPDTQDDLGS